MYDFIFSSFSVARQIQAYSWRTVSCVHVIYESSLCFQFDGA
jgi:hypothetical protein